MQSSSPQSDPLVQQLSLWFRDNGEDKKKLLPQHLPQALLDKLIQPSEKESGLQDTSQWNALLTAVGLIYSDENKKFTASRGDIQLAVKAYQLNLMLESLIRLGIIQFKIPFELENILDLSFERNIELTATGKEAAKHAGSQLSQILSGFSNQLQ